MDKRGVNSPQKSPSLEKLFRADGGYLGAGGLYADGQLREQNEEMLFGDAVKF